MLARSAKTNYSSVIQSPGSVQPLERYITNLQAPAAFPSLESDQTDKEEKNADEQQGDQSQRKKALQEFELLAPRNDFQEMFNNFFVLGHKELLMLQAEIRSERGISNTYILALHNIDNLQVQALRRQYYQLQMILFKMSKGDKHTSEV